MERRVIAHVDMHAFYCQVGALIVMHLTAAQHARALRLSRASRTRPRAEIGAELPAVDCSARAAVNRRRQVESRRDASLRGRPLCVLQRAYGCDPYDTS